METEDTAERLLSVNRCPETSIHCLIGTKLGQAQKMDSTPVSVIISHEFLQVYMEAIPLDFRLVIGVIPQTRRREDAGLWMLPALGMADG